MPRRALAIALLSVLGATAWAATFTSVDPRMGVVYVVSPTDLVEADGSLASDAPLLTNFLGIGTTLSLGDLLAFEPALDLYYGYDLWSPNNGRVLPAEIASRTSFTMAFLLQMPLVLGIDFAGRWRISAGLGPAFNFRAGLLASMSAADAAVASKDMPRINAWFWSGLRWFQPETFLRLSFRLTQRLDFSFAAVAFWPVYNLWLPAALPLDGGIFGGEIGVKARLQ